MSFWYPLSEPSTSMIVEKRQLITNELVEVQDCKRITDHSRGIYRIHPNLIKENRRMPARNRLDLPTLGSQLVMPKNCYGFE